MPPRKKQSSTTHSSAKPWASAARAQGGKFGGEGQRCDVRQAIRLANPQHRGAHAGARCAHIRINGRKSVGNDVVCIARTNLRPRNGEVLGCDGLSQNGAVCTAAGYSQRFGAAHASDDERHNGGRPLQNDSIKLHMAAMHAEAFATQQGARGKQCFFQQCQRAGRPRANLAHPGGHTVPDAHGNAAGEELGEGGNLERGESGIAHGGRQNANAYMDARRGRKHGCGLRNAAPKEAVFDNPQFGEAVGIRGACKRQYIRGGQIARQHYSDGWGAHGNLLCPPLARHNPHMITAGWVAGWLGAELCINCFGAQPRLLPRPHCLTATIPQFCCGFRNCQPLRPGFLSCAKRHIGQVSVRRVDGPARAGAVKR